MKKRVALTVGFLLQAFLLTAQDTLCTVNCDTVVLKKYEDGKVVEIRTWIGSEFKYSPDFVTMEEPAGYWDTIDAFELSGFEYVRGYDQEGRLESEELRIRGEEQYYRSYYYSASDSIFGYQEFDSQTEGIIVKHIRFKEFWPDSTIRIMGMKVNGNVDGRYETFYRNGNRQCYCFYRAGRRDSLQTVYHENGQIWQQLVYDNGLLMEVLANNDPNGNPLETGALKNGTGTFIKYDEQGKIEKTMYFKSGKIKKEVYPDGYQKRYIFGTRVK